VIRRKFITLLGGTVATWPLATRAQQPERMRRVGILMPLTVDDPYDQTRLAAFLQGLGGHAGAEMSNAFADRRWNWWR